MTNKGLFITLEGCEGTGKTSALACIERVLQGNGIEVVMTREPGGTPFAEEIRHILLSPREEAVNPVTELLLIFAARAQHLQNTILPALNAGKWVVSSRWTDSTWVYQSLGRGLPANTITELERMTGCIHPDLTILLDIEAQIGLSRTQANGELDRIELEPIKFFKNVRRAFLDRAKAEPNRFSVIDATPPVVEVQAAISERIDAFVKDYVVSQSLAG